MVLVYRGVGDAKKTMKKGQKESVGGSVYAAYYVHRKRESRVDELTRLQQLEQDLEPTH